MKLALCQMRIENYAGWNFGKNIKLFQEAVSQGADLILFPELQLCRIFPQYEKRNVSEHLIEIDAPFLNRLRMLCRQYGVMAAPNIYI